MARILRGDILWADLNPVQGHEQAGLRPILVLSDKVFNQRSGTVIAVALTSQPQRSGFPLTLELTSMRLPKQTWVKISQIRTLATNDWASGLGVPHQKNSTRLSRDLTNSSAANAAPT